jgi:hypothetical protein
MKYPETFPADLKYLAEYYGWNSDDKKEIRAAFTDSAPMVKFFTVLAAAHRAGYAQSVANGFIRLQTWCLEKGLPDPFGPEFDLATLDALVVEPRRAA